MDVETIRSQVPALSKFVWFQNGFVSLTPTPIAEEHARLMRELYENGPMHLLHPDVEVPRRTASVEPHRRVPARGLRRGSAQNGGERRLQHRD